MMYYHIGFFFEKGPTAENILRAQDALNKVAFDWLRYGNNSWVICSNATADRIYIALREVVVGADQFLILPLDPSRQAQGYVSQWIWDWLRIDRSRPGWEAEKQKILDVLSPPPPPPSLASIFGGFGGALGHLGLPPPKKD